MVRVVRDDGRVYYAHPFRESDIQEGDFDEYHKQIKESEGFYIDMKCSPNIYYGILPVPLDDEDEYPVVQFSKLAVDTFNQRLNRKNTDKKLEFVKVVNATGEYVSGFKYHLTFEAKNIATGEKATYQAVVLDGLSSKGETKVRVLSFRLKPNSPQDPEKTWYWLGHLCSTKVKVGEGPHASLFRRRSSKPNRKRKAEECDPGVGGDQSLDTIGAKADEDGEVSSYCSSPPSPPPVFDESRLYLLYD